VPNFGRTTPATPGVIVVDGTITFTARAQTSVNNTAVALINSFFGGTLTQQNVAILLGGSPGTEGFTQATTSIRESLLSAGVSSTDADELIDSLSGVAGCDSDAGSTCKTSNVKAENLNNAIQKYNQILNAQPPANVAQLSANEEFKAINQALARLRGAI
jgi:hypothetical protein